jgi:hypothetical protein
MNLFRRSKPRNIVAAGALLVAGFGGGAALAAGGVADAASSVTNAQGDDGHPGETLLTGTTAAKVEAAALAEYPGATVDRVETDSDGVYEGHIITKAGDDVVVQIDETFTVTGSETLSGRGADDHHGHERGGLEPSSSSAS